MMWSRMRGANEEITKSSKKCELELHDDSDWDELTNDNNAKVEETEDPKPENGESSVAANEEKEPFRSTEYRVNQ